MALPPLIVIVLLALLIVLLVRVCESDVPTTVPVGTIFEDVGIPLVSRTKNLLASANAVLIEVNGRSVIVLSSPSITLLVRVWLSVVPTTTPDGIVLESETTTPLISLFKNLLASPKVAINEVSAISVTVASLPSIVIVLFSLSITLLVNVWVESVVANARSSDPS